MTELFYSHAGITSLLLKPVRMLQLGEAVGLCGEPSSSLIFAESLSYSD